MKIAMTSVPVEDPVRAFEFYTGVLGFEEFLFMPEAWLAIVVSPEDRSGTALLLEPNEHPAYRTFQETIYAEGLPCITFGTDDIQAEYERLTSRGVTFRQEPTATEAGTLATFDDTFGNLIQLFQAP